MKTNATFTLTFKFSLVLLVCVAAADVRSQTADAFNPGANTNVNALAVQADGKILVGGSFTQLVGQVRHYLGRLNADGTLDAAFRPVDAILVNSLVVQADGKILVAGGLPSSFPPYYTNLILRLNPNGTRDPAFNAGTGSDDYVDCLAVQSDGKILVGGYIHLWLNGGPQGFIVRLNTNGSFDTTFRPSMMGVVSTFALQPDGKILAGGLFTMSERNYVARLNANGTLDTSFAQPPIDGTSPWVNCLALQPDGKIWVTWRYYPSGQSGSGPVASKIARLNADGTLDSSFTLGTNGPNGVVWSLVQQADGKILVGGDFTTLAGQPCNHIGRLFGDGTLDGSFNPGANGSVTALALQPDGRVLVGGNFTILAGQMRRNIGRLTNGVPATQSLVFDSSTITWTWLWGGASPEASYTTFEVTTNNADWIQLGLGTRVTGGWRLTGASYPANNCIRARGFLAGGYHDASSYFVESRTAPFISLQPISRVRTPGQTAVFSVSVNGVLPLSYQWFKEGTSLVDGGNVSGAKTSTLTLSMVSFGDTGGYRLIVSNSFNSVTSAVAYLEVVPSVINLSIDPATNNPAAVAELVNAVKTATTNSWVYTIRLFPNGVYTFTQPDNWEYGPNALPQIAGDITINGQGAVLQRATNAPKFRFFYVSGGLSYDSISGLGLPTGVLTLQNLTLQGGLAKGGNGGAGGGGMGGAIFNQGTVTLSGVNLSGNVALGGDGGGGSGNGGGIGGDATGTAGGGFGGPFAGVGGSGGGVGAYLYYTSGGGGGGFRPIDNGSPGWGGADGSGQGGGVGGLGGFFYTFSPGNPDIFAAGPDGGSGGSTSSRSFIGGAGGSYGFGGSVPIDYGGGGGGIGGGGGASPGVGDGGCGGFGGGGGNAGWNSAGRGGFGGGGGAGNPPSRGGFGGGAGAYSGWCGGGGAGLGGAIFNHRGVLALTNCYITANMAKGGDTHEGNVNPDYASWPGGGYGGGVFNLNGTVVIHACTMVANTTAAGSSNYRTYEQDGNALYNLAYGSRIEDGSSSTAITLLIDSTLATPVSSTSVGGPHDLVNNKINGKSNNTATVSYQGRNVVLNSTNLSGATSIGAPDFGPLALVPISHVDGIGAVYGVIVSSNYAYLACGTDGLRIYDVSDPANPVSMAQITNAGSAVGVAVKDNVVALACDSAGLYLYDVSNPALPAYLASTNDGGNAQSVCLWMNYACLANGTNGLRIYDISDPSNPKNIGHVYDGGSASGVKVAGHYVYLANYTGYGELRVYDISNPAHPVLAGQSYDFTALNVALGGNFAYVVRDRYGLRVYKIVNQTNFVRLTSISEDSGTAFDVTLMGRVCVLANGSDGLRLYDISNPSNPLRLAHANDGGIAKGVAVSGQYIYLANSSDGLRIYYLVGAVPSMAVTLTNGLPKLTSYGSPGDTYRVQASTNLFDWQTICTLTNVNGTVEYTDTGTTAYEQRFYRLVLP